MPHITWCLAGPLTFLPIHAAGLYDMKDKPKIFHYVVSSYTPTLSQLLSAKHRSQNPSQMTRLLTISQPATPGQSRLPGTVGEVDAVQAVQAQTGRFDVTRLDDQRQLLQPCCIIFGNAAGSISLVMAFRTPIIRPTAHSSFLINP